MTTHSTRSPIPITILAGFLGSGKTTLMNTLLHSEHGLRVAVMVNDFGAVNIDSQLVVNVDGDEADMVSLSNGCICCTIRGDLLRAMVELLRRQEKPEYIIIETSGVSDPVGVASTFLMPDLRPYVRLDNILTVIDAEQGGDALEGDQYFLAMSQVGVADIVVVNRIDLVDAIQLQEIRTWVREIVPRARIIETSFGKVPPELVLGVGAYAPERLEAMAPKDIHVHEAGVPADHDHDHHDHDHDEGGHGHDQQPDHSLVFETWNWRTDEPLSLKALRRVIENLPLTIYRAKGFVHLAEMPENRGALHVVGRRVSLTHSAPWREEETPHSQLVVIGSFGGVDPDDLHERFEVTLVRNQPASEFERIKDGLMEWIRWRKLHGQTAAHKSASFDTSAAQALF
ncbi:MAG: GTP-binding protein [Chloroflexi bacterium]|nr:GTP-binding protein [Chloroflexota bacterium]